MIHHWPYCPCINYISIDRILNIAIFKRASSQMVNISKWPYAMDALLFWNIMEVPFHLACYIPFKYETSNMEAWIGIGFYYSLCPRCPLSESVHIQPPPPPLLENGTAGLYHIIIIQRNHFRILHSRKSCEQVSITNIYYCKILLRICELDT